MGNKCLKRRQDQYALPTKNVEEKNYQNLSLKLKKVEEELQATKNINNTLLKQIEAIEKNQKEAAEKKQQESKSNIKKCTLVNIEDIADMLKSADLTIDMFDLTDPLNENIDQIPSGYLSLKLNKKYWNYNNKRATPSSIQQWTTLYHGTSKNFSKQIIESNLKGGQNNRYGGKNCRLTNTTIASGPNANIYLSSSITEAEKYSVNKSEFQGNQYKIVFQCKVNPQGYQSPTECPTLFIVQDNMNVIPEFMLITQ